MAADVPLPARAIAFAWETVAADGVAVRGAIGRLARAGVVVIVIAAHPEAVAAELAPLRGRARRNVVIVPDRGGETIAGLVGTVLAPAGLGRDDLRLLTGGEVVARLQAESALHPVELPATPTADAAWTLVEEGWVLAREHEFESLFAIGNGFVGSRGALAEGSPLSAPATFVAGVFDAPPGGVPQLAVAPEWAQVAATINDGAFRLDVGQPLEHWRTLDMKQGILFRHWRHRDPAGRITRIEGMRLASLADRHLLLQSITFTPENYGGAVTVEAAALSRGLPLHTSSGVVVELVARSHLEDPTGRFSPPPPEGEGPERWRLPLDVGRTYRLDRIAHVHTTRGPHARGGHDDEEVSLEEAVAAHVAAWRARWARSDLIVDGDDEAQRALRFAIYHLVSAANPEDPGVSVGARGLTGPAYKGHVFWDTDIFMLPFYVLAYPEAARALLLYRHRTLPAAKARAQAMGWAGALYAWESADTGDDVTPPFVIMPSGEVLPIHIREQEQHISADVAYAVWRYWQVSGDVGFLVDAGAEILIETARFWASRARLEGDGRCHIRGVIGPDEYHESVDDDVYTNGMAQWNLEIAARAVGLLESRWPDRFGELRARLALRPDEPEAWRRTAAALTLNFDPRTGLFEQFQGYFALEELDLAAYEPRTAPMEVLVGIPRLRRTKVLKQPDVLMLIYLLWNRFPPAVREANFRYYDPRTSHGSSLSPPIHATLAARLGDVRLATRYFRQTAAIDLANNMGNAAGGVHLAALGGLWQAAVFGFAGLTFTEEGPHLDPRLPPSWRGLRFAVEWRGRTVPLSVEATSQPEVHP